MDAIIGHSQEACLIWGCIAFVLIVAFGNTVSNKLKVLNKKHHIITWDDEDNNYYE